MESFRIVKIPQCTGNVCKFYVAEIREDSICGRRRDFLYLLSVMCKQGARNDDSVAFQIQKIAPVSALARKREGEESDGQRDEAVVLLNVPLQDFRAFAEHAFEAGPVELDALEQTLGDHGCSARPIEQQRDLTCGKT